MTNCFVFHFVYKFYEREKLFCEELEENRMTNALLMKIERKNNEETLNGMMNLIFLKYICRLRSLMIK